MYCIGVLYSVIEITCCCNKMQNLNMHINKLINTFGCYIKKKVRYIVKRIARYTYFICINF